MKAFTNLTGGRMGKAALVVIAATVFWSTAGAARAAEPPKKIPEPEEVMITTGAGSAYELPLAATFYPGSHGKETVPIVLLHMHKRSRADYRDLALYLQQLGHAVLVPDLRGHGDSLSYASGTKLDAAKMPVAEFDRMVRIDMGDAKRGDANRFYSIKDFLWKKNNEGALNLNKLCVVGAEMGASVAVGFAAYDWLPRGAEYPYYGALQQGRFVKALVLISPEVSFKGMNMPGLLQTMGELNRSIAVLILVGSETSRANADAKRVHSLLERYHPEPEGENKKEKQTLFFGQLSTSLQGTKMLGVRGLNVEKHIATFIDLRLVKSDVARAITWKELKLPHE